MKPENLKQVTLRGDRIRIARRSRGMTQDELAQALGLARTTVTNLETGFAETSIGTLAQLAYVLKVSADYLLDLDEGRDELMTLSPDEQMVLKAYRSRDAAEYMRLFTEKRET